MTSGVCIGEVYIQQQPRQSLALRVTPEGLVALIPQGLDPDASSVRRFIERGLARIPTRTPVRASERFAVEDLHRLVANWAGRLGVPVERVQVRRMRTKWASCQDIRARQRLAGVDGHLSAGLAGAGETVVGVGIESEGDIAKGSAQEPSLLL